MNPAPVQISVGAPFPDEADEERRGEPYRGERQNLFHEPVAFPACA